jgi:hypothetical protein
MGFFSSLTKMTMNIIETPIAVAKDVATLGGALTDQDTPYTAQKLEDIAEDWQDAKDSLDD